MAVVGMVRERVAATPNHHFDISRDFGGSLVGEMGTLYSNEPSFIIASQEVYKK